MNESKLNQLSQITPPEAAAEAKQRALNAGQQAFLAADMQATENKTKKSQNHQGFFKFMRLTSKSNTFRGSLMKKIWLISGGLAGVAATLVAVMYLAGYSLQFGSPNSGQVMAGGGALGGAAVPSSEGMPLPRFEKRAQKIASTKPTVANTPEQGLVMESRRGLSGNDAYAEVSSQLRAQARAGQIKQGLRERGSSMHGVVRPKDDAMMPQPAYEGRDQFENIANNPIKLVSQEPVSTFSIDVDTSAYAFVRGALNHGTLPQKNVVRIEELINYFDYNYAVPKEVSQPFKPTVAVYPTPWNADTKLVHIGIKGHEMKVDVAPRSNLVFLLDVSGSMSTENKLPLLKNALRMLVNGLHADDRVSIVTYAGRAATVLKPTRAADKQAILAALNNLEAGGSTAGAQGIEQAYALAKQHYDAEGVNRVMLATDGDFNVGITDREELKGYIERQRDSGIYLSVLGFGRGIYNDALMQTLAQNGNGNAAYIDTLNEARKVLVDEASSMLYPIANDVKIQVEFNPNTVAEYRLIGYENRLLKREDFNNDKVDAGDIGAGHTVTAIYEITPVGSKAQLIDDLRYAEPEPRSRRFNMDGKDMEYGFLKMRYKRPGENKSQLLTMPINHVVELKGIDQASNDIRFAASVAAFGQLLRGDAYIKEMDYKAVIKLAQSSKGEDSFGYRSEFIQLLRLAQSNAK